MIRYTLLALVASLFLVQIVAAAPTITIHSPQQNQFLNSTTVFVNVSVNTTSNLSYKIDTANFSAFGQNTNSSSTTITALEGNHTLTIQVSDSSGNSTASAVFTIDSTPPNIILNSPENGAKLKASQADLVFTASDNLARILSCSLLINDNQRQSKLLENPRKTQFTEQPLSAGNYNWTISCKDEAGNLKSETRNFSVDSVCGILSYNLGVENKTIKYLVRNQGTVDYFFEYLIKVNLAEVSRDFVQLKVGEEKTVQKPYDFNTSQSYRIETEVKADCGSKDSLLIQYSLGTEGVRCSNPTGASFQIIKDPNLPRLIQCIEGNWTAYGSESTYCASEFHCGDLEKNCGETEFSCPQDFNVTTICDCSRKIYIVGVQNRTGSGFFDPCKNTCNLQCFSDSDCNNGFACSSDYRCLIKPGACKLDIEDLETPPYTVVNGSSHVLLKTVNKGQVATNVTLKFFLNNALDSQFLFELEPGEVDPRTLYYNTNRPPGSYELKMRAEASCGESVEKLASTEILSKTIIEYNFTQPKVTLAELTPESLALVEGEDKAFKLNLKTTKPQFFDIQVSGLDPTWLDFPKTVGTGREKDVFIHLTPQEKGEYNLTISVSSEEKNFTFSRFVTVSPKEQKTENMLYILAGIIIVFVIVVSIGYKKLE